MAVKVKLGKLNLPVPLQEMEQEVVRQGFHWLQLQNSHILALENLERYKEHKDPFELVAQSRVESMELLTSDKVLEPYGVTFYRRTKLEKR